MSSRPSPDDHDFAALLAARDWLGVVAATESGSDGEAAFARAEALRRLGRGDEALELVRSVEQASSADHRSRALVASLLSRFGEHAGAIDAWSAAIAALPPRTAETRLSQLIVERAEDQLSLGCLADARTAMLALARRRRLRVAEMSVLRRAVADTVDLDRLVALLAPLATRPGAIARASLTQLSLAWRDAGQDDLAIAAARQRLLVGLAQTPAGSLARAENLGWRDEAEVAFGDLVDDLHRLGERPFLASGTLLGHVRDGGIIAHDKDLDLGLFTDTPIDLLAARLATTGRFRLRPASAERLIQVEHANGVTADIFLHWQEDGRALHGGRRGTWWNSPIDLVEATMLGRRVLVPRDADTYLAENYGPGWRTPDPDFETFLDTPNLVPPPRTAMIWYYLTKLHDLHGAGKGAGVARVWAALVAAGGADPALATALAQYAL